MAWFTPLLDAVTRDRRPVRLRGDDCFAVEVVAGEQATLARIASGRDEDGAEHFCWAELVCDRRNAARPDTVRVLIHGRPVGCLRRNEGRAYRRRLERLGLTDRRATCEAVIVGGRDRDSESGRDLQVRLDLLWPVEVAERD